MATLTVQNITRAGLNPTFAAAAGGGDRFLPSPKTFLHIKNGGGGSITATVVSPAFALNDIPIDDFGVPVAAGAERILGPWPADLFADPADGLVPITYTGVASVTIAVFKLNQP